MQKQLNPEQVIAVLAQIIREAGPATQTIGGKIGFRVQGELGGDWIVDLDRAGGAWTRPEDDESVGRASVALYAFPEAFSSLLTDPAAIEDAMRSGYLVVEGDRSKLQRLSKLLSTGGNMLAQRSSGAARKPPKKKLTRTLVG